MVVDPRNIINTTRGGAATLAGLHVRAAHNAIPNAVASVPQPGFFQSIGNAVPGGFGTIGFAIGATLGFFRASARRTIANRTMDTFRRDLKQQANRVRVKRVVDSTLLSQQSTEQSADLRSAATGESLARTERLGQVAALVTRSQAAIDTHSRHFIEDAMATGQALADQLNSQMRAPIIDMAIGGMNSAMNIMSLTGYMGRDFGARQMGGIRREIDGYRQTISAFQEVRAELFNEIQWMKRRAYAEKLEEIQAYEGQVQGVVDQIQGFVRDKLGEAPVAQQAKFLFQTHPQTSFGGIL